MPRVPLPRTLITSERFRNSIHFVSEGRVRTSKALCGTHFNPPVIVKLLKSFQGLKQILKFWLIPWWVWEQFLRKNSGGCKTPLHSSETIGIFGIKVCSTSEGNGDRGRSRQAYSPVVDAPKCHFSEPWTLLKFGHPSPWQMGFMIIAQKDEAHDLFKLPTFDSKNDGQLMIWDLNQQILQKNQEGWWVVKFLALDFGLVWNTVHKKSTIRDTPVNFASWIRSRLMGFHHFSQWKDKAASLPKNFRTLFAYATCNIPRNQWQKPETDIS